MGVRSLASAAAKRSLKAGLQPLGYTMARRTKPSQLQDLLTSLHPINSSHDLTRLGPARDGGYLVPDDLAGIETCLSAGVGDNSDFELDCAERGMVVHLTDASVDGPAAEHPNFRFQRMHLGVIESTTTTTLNRWSALGLGASTADALLKVDIEGAEYSVLASASDETLLRARIVVVEFHDIDQLFLAASFPFLRAAFDRLTANHVCVHIHPNNCCGEVTESGVTLPRLAEFTFLRRDRVRSQHPATVFPHPLDVECTSAAPLALPRSLYGNPR